MHAVEEVLWAMFGATDYDATSDHYSRGATPANDVIVPGSTTTILFRSPTNQH